MFGSTIKLLSIKRSFELQISINATCLEKHQQVQITLEHVACKNNFSRLDTPTFMKNKFSCKNSFFRGHTH